MKRWIKYGALIRQGRRRPHPKGHVPPFSTRIEEEGIQLDNVLLVEGGEMREQAMLELLQSGPYPSRNPAQNLADLRAQIAANEKGAQELRAMGTEGGGDRRPDR